MCTTPFSRIVVAALALSGGCASVSPYPDAWAEVETNETWCRHPAGEFANLPVESSAEGEPPLPLAEIFFGPLLGGFDVTHLAFDTLPGGELRVRPWVGDTELREVRIIEPAAERCGKERWLVRSGWESHPYESAYIAFRTFGALLPVASQGYFSLERDADGRLVVHAVARTAGMALYFIPFRTRLEDAWFAYQPEISGEIRDAK